MFTGLIEEVGRVTGLVPAQSGLKLQLAAELVTADLAIGDSLAINGVCLTVTALAPGQFGVEAVSETLSRSTLGAARVGESVNLERALQVGQRLGGHFVQGHVDGRGRVEAMTLHGEMYWLTLSLPDELMRYIIMKGSIAVEGISLTVAEKQKESIAIAIIPHTHRNTTLGLKKTGDLVNIEVDMMAKYAENFLLSIKSPGKPISLELLKEHGFA